MRTYYHYLEFSRLTESTLKTFVEYIERNLPEGVAMKVTKHERKPLPDTILNTIKNEASNGVSNKKYTVAMARTSDPNSATAQFFINLIDNGFLDKNSQSAGYAVFGQVVEGNEVVDAMGKVKTGNRGLHQDVPVEPITIESVKVVEAKN